MSFKRKEYDKRRNPVARYNQLKGGPHGPSDSVIKKRIKEQVILEELDDWDEVVRDPEEDT